MKRISKIIAIVFIISIAISAKSQDIASVKADSTGLPGDNFSLPGALEMFKNAKNIEEFEKLLNQENNNVNNLDLNEDGKIDYVRVVDNTKDNAHAVVLQVPVNKTEFQDIAVIEIEKQSAEKVSVQIVGDEDIYGENVIYEPQNEKNIDNGNVKSGPSSSYYETNIWFNAWYWPCVQFIYAPAYVAWVSPWYWDYYPYWWRPWNPYPWGYYYHHCYHYHDYYHHSYNHYGNHAYQAYQPHRRTSNYVVNRHRDDITNYRNNHGNDRRDNIGKTTRKDNINIGNNNNRNQSNYSKPRTVNGINQNRNTINSSRKDNSVNKSERKDNTIRNSNSNSKNDKTNNNNYKENNNKSQNNGNVSSGRSSNKDKGSVNQRTQSTPSSSSVKKSSKTSRSAGKK